MGTKNGDKQLDMLFMCIYNILYIYYIVGNGDIRNAQW